MQPETQSVGRSGPVGTVMALRCGGLFGSVVRLVPTEGCHQKERKAIMLCETASEYRVRIVDESKVRRFRKSTMLHVSPYDRQFPNYRLSLPNSKDEPMPTGTGSSNGNKQSNT